MDVTGTLKHKYETKQITEKFQKKDFILRIEGEYPQDILFQLSQAKCDLLDNIKTGSTIKVHFNLRGRGFTDPQGQIKYYNTLESWRVEKMIGSNNATPIVESNGDESEEPF